MSPLMIDHEQVHKWRARWDDKHVPPRGLGRPRSPPLLDCGPPRGSSASPPRVSPPLWRSQSQDSLEGASDSHWATVRSRIHEVAAMRHEAGGSAGGGRGGLW